MRSSIPIRFVSLNSYCLLFFVNTFLLSTDVRFPYKCRIIPLIIIYFFYQTMPTGVEISRGPGKGRYDRRDRSGGLRRDRYGCRHRSGGLGRDGYGRRDRSEAFRLVRRFRKPDRPVQCLGGVDREDPLLMVGRLVPAEPAVSLVQVVLLVHPEAVRRVLALQFILLCFPNRPGIARRWSKEASCRYRARWRSRSIGHRSSPLRAMPTPVTGSLWLSSGENFKQT